MSEIIIGIKGIFIIIFITSIFSAVGTWFGCKYVDWLEGWK